MFSSHRVIIGVVIVRNQDARRSIVNVIRLVCRALIYVSVWGARMFSVM